MHGRNECLLCIRLVYDYRKLCLTSGPSLTCIDMDLYMQVHARARDSATEGMTLSLRANLEIYTRHDYALRGQPVS